MYKILIVDDEQNILDGLAASVPWNEVSAEVVGTAVDGMDATIILDNSNLNRVLNFLVNKYGCKKN